MMNKMDSTGVPDPDFYEFYNLGLGDPIAVSAVHGHGTGDLLDACLQYFPPEEEEEEEDDAIKVAVIGRPAQQVPPGEQDPGRSNGSSSPTCRHHPETPSTQRIT